MNPALHLSGTLSRLKLSALAITLIITVFGIQLLPAKSASTIFKKLRTLPLGKATELKIPTYDGSNQSVHPDIMLLNHSKFKTSSFALAFTPYPNANDKLENPSIALSKDGINWAEPKKGTNPLAAMPPYDHNNDADITYDPATKQYYIHYLETCRPDSQNVIRLVSTDLLKWKRQTAIHYPFSDKSIFMVSPALIRKSASEWYMYYVNNFSKPTRIEYLVSKDGINWNRKDIRLPGIKNSPNFIPWHVDVFQGNGYYYMLTCGMVENPSLYLARSTDLINWEYYAQPIVNPGKDVFDSIRIYRSTGLQDGNNLYVWFSYRTEDKSWGMAVQRFDLKKLGF